jgi:hypothetical protein
MQSLVSLTGRVGNEISFQKYLFTTASSSTVSDDAGNEPRTVVTSALAVRHSSHSVIHTRLHLIHARLQLVEFLRPLQELSIWIYCQRLTLPRFVRVVSSSAEWFVTEFLEFFYFSSGNGIPSCFLFPWRVRKGIPRFYFYFCSTERNSDLFSLLLKVFGREFWNFEIMLLFLVHRMEFRVVFSFTEGFGTEFREFLFRGTAGILSEITICSVYSVFRGIIFLSEIPNPTHWMKSQSVGLTFPVSYTFCL